MRYRIRFVSEQVYIVDTTDKFYRPEGFPNSPWAPMFPVMDPKHPEFTGTVLDQLPAEYPDEEYAHHQWGM